VQEQQLLDKSPTQNMQSYSLYLKGRSRYNTYTAEGIQDAIRLFEEAIEKDVSFALAYAGLADAYAQAAVSYGLLPVSYLDSARMLAEMSVQIDPTLAEGWKALGLNYQYRGKLQQAQASYETALQYNPNYYPAVSNLVPVYGLQDLFHKAMETAAKTLQLDPLNGNSYVNYADGLRFLRMTDSALVVLDKGLKMDPKSNSLWFTRAKALVDMERNKEAEASLRKCIELDTSLSFGFRAADYALLFDPELAKEFTRGTSLDVLQDSVLSPFSYSILSYLSKDQDTARRYLDAGIRYFERQIELGNVSIDFTQHLVRLYAMRGDREKALALLEQNIMKRGVVHLMELERDPRLENIRTDPRFQDLLDYIRNKTGKWRMEFTGGTDLSTENL
jgi:tetratricopeptide (TPR) repeat protein